MIGTIVNTCTILLGSIIGSLLKKGLKEKYQNVLFIACGMAALGVGMNAVVTHMGKSNYPVLFIVSLAIGGVVGTMLDLDAKFQTAVNRRSKSELGQGLSTGILMFCIGTLSIMGPVMAAVNKDYTYLFTNATLDLVTSMVLASTYGIGMILSAPVLFCWQGSIYLIAKYASETLISEELLCELCIVGGFLIFASGLGILKVKDLKTLNLLPSLLVPIIFLAIKAMIGF